MKKYLPLILNLFFALCVKAQGYWTQKESLKLARTNAVGFSIGNKGYIGTGYDGSVYKQDFWEWDPTTNTWVQKADFPATPRRNATGFSIGTKGYIGIGSDNNFYGNPKQDLWEWNQSTNSWTQKANLGGPVRENAIGFSIGSKGYIGTGDFYNGNYTFYNDFWEWDSNTNTWTQMANFPGKARQGAVSFSIGNMGYVGMGNIGSLCMQNFWVWDQSTNAWTLVANCGGIGREGAVGFSIGLKGYIGTGNNGNNILDDFWEYTPFSTIGMEETESVNKISIYPNPTSGKFYVVSTEKISSAEIENILGEKVYSAKVNTDKAEVDLGLQPKGIYFVKIICGRERSTKKIILE